MWHERIGVFALALALSCGESTRDDGSAGAAAHGGTSSGMAGSGASGGTDGATGGEAGGAAVGGTNAGRENGGHGGTAAHGGAAGRGTGGSQAGEGGFGGALPDDTGGAVGTGGAPPMPCILFVNGASGDDHRNGRSWKTAVATVTRALALSDYGCEVWITHGTYVPGNERSSTFSVVHGERLVGGFDGDELSYYERPSSGEPTILSGEIGKRGTTNDNALHVVTTSGSELLGITIAGGNASDDSDGGGAIVASGKLELVDCEVRDNSARGMGGAVLAQGSVDIVTTSFRNNTAGDAGGALAVIGDTTETLTVSDAVFESNSANSGAAIHTNVGSVTVDDAAFTQNVATLGGGGIEAQQDADGSLSVTYSNFDSNRAADGAAILTSDALDLEDSQFTSNVVGAGAVIDIVGDAVISGNHIEDSTGTALGSFCRSTGCSVRTFANSFSGNQAAEGAALRAKGSNVTDYYSGFAFNVTTGRGGAILIQDGQLDLNSDSFQGNGAGSDGGAVYLENTALHVTTPVSTTEFTRNTARSGGAIYADETSSVDLSQCFVTNNSASEAGGGLFLAGALSATLTVSDLSGNTAKDGAALFRKPMSAAETVLNGMTVANNVGSGRGAIDSAGTLRVINSIVWVNEPRDFEFDDDDTLILDSSNLTGVVPDVTAFDPHFRDLVLDRRLTGDSPCIDTANDLLAAPEDLYGDARFDVPGVPVCAQDQPNCGSIADMGAFEYGRQ